MKIRTTFILLCLSACVVFVTSCASLGPVYQKNDPPSGKAVIYVYRPCCGAPAVSYLLWDVTDAIATKKVEIVYDQGKDYPRIDNFSEGLKFGKKLTRIVSGSYYAYTVNPGTYYLLVENTGFGKQWGISGGRSCHKSRCEGWPAIFFLLLCPWRRQTVPRIQVRCERRRRNSGLQDNTGRKIARDIKTPLRDGTRGRKP